MHSRRRSVSRSGWLFALVLAGIPRPVAAQASAGQFQGGVQIDAQPQPGAGGTDCVVAGPAAGFDNFSALVEKCGFLAGERE